MAKRLLATLFILCATLLGFDSCAYAKTPTQIVLWHSMAGSLGETLNNLIQKFNQSQSDYEVVPVYKGDYPETLTATIAAFRSGKQPDIAQVLEVGTATLLHPPGMVVPVNQLMQQTNTSINVNDILPEIRFYYSDPKSGLLALPFNSSSPVLFYNKAAFTKAGLDPNNPPKTWDELAQDAQKILKAGYSCGFTTGWPSWIQVESFSAWHNLPLASQNNGFDGLNATLEFNNPTVVKHVAQVADWQKQHIFMYAGREDQAMPLFTSGQCAMLMESSGSVPDLVSYSQFPVGVAALPYMADVKGAPQNTIIGGAALWALSGRSAENNKGIAQFFAFWLSPDTQMAWSKATGYLPVTQTAYQALQAAGYYKTNPGSEIAIKELLNHQPTDNSRGFRLGNYMAIRNIINQQLESAWSGETTAQQAMDAAVQQGNQQLKQFEQNVSN